MNRRLASVQDWAIGIDRRTGSLAVLGVVLSLLVVSAIGIVFALFTGVFTKYDAIEVKLPLTSTAALSGSSVQFRDVAVGKVVGEARTASDGTAVVEVHLRPGQIKRIPASVRASVLPISVFGNQYVVLEPPADPGAQVLRAGGTVQAKQDAPMTSLQQAVTSIDRLVVALHPAELNVALTAVAQALQGQGQQLGQTADVASAYLGAMQPLWPRVVQDLGLLAPVANQIAASSPDIVGILGNSLTTAGTITSNADALRQLLGNSGTFADQAEQLSTDIERPFSLLSAASGPFLSAVASRPDNISRLLDGLDGFANAVIEAGKYGPFLHTEATVNVRNAANLATAALGGSDVAAQLAQGLPPGLVDPPTYGSGSRPTFPLPTTPAADRTPELEAPGAVVPVLPADAERRAIDTITSALAGARPGSVDVASLLLSPLLSSLGQQS